MNNCNENKNCYALRIVLFSVAPPDTGQGARHPLLLKVVHGGLDNNPVGVPLLAPGSPVLP